jgi:hypothetical protein
LRAWFDHTKDDPIGEQRADLRAGIVASSVANGIRMVLAAWGGKRIKESDLLRPSDFMPRWGGAQDADGDGSSNRPASKPRAPMTEVSEWEKLKNMARAYMGERPNNL